MSGAERAADGGRRPSRGGPRDRQPVVPVGPVPVRAGLGHGARGLQRRRRRLGLLPARPRPVAGLPLERGRAWPGSATSSPGCAWPRAVERPRPDPQGADVRAHRQRGQPRRGRQGVLVVPRRRCPSHSWLRWRYHYPQAAFPYDDLVAENGRAARKLEPEYELLDTGVFDDDRYWVVEVDYAKADPDDVLMRVDVRNAGPEAATLHVLPTLWFRNTWSWDPSTAEPALPRRRRRRVDPRRARRARRLPLDVGAGPDGDRARPAVLRERDQHRAPVRRRPTTTRLSQGRHQRPRRARRRRRSTRTGPAPRPRPGTGSPSRRARRPRSGCGCDSRPSVTATRDRARTGGRTRSARRSTRRCASARPRPTSSTPTSRRPDATARRRASCARPSPGCSGASSSTATTSPAGSTATRPSRRRRRSG